MVQPSLGVDGDGEWLGGKSPQWSERRARLEELIVTLRIADELAAGKYLITSGELAELMDVHASAVTSRGEEWTWRNWQISRVRRESNQILWQLERIDVSKEPSSEAPPRVICERGCEQVMDLDFPLECFDYDLSATALAHFLNADQLAVDTETMGLNIPRDRLCLVQLCDPQGQVAVVKIGRGQREAPHLQQLLEHPRITKIFHYARFDLATLRYHLGIRVHPVFCTKIASKIARTYSPRHGLKDLVLDLLGVEIDKSAQSSDWGNTMALREDQIRYAANDVRYLIPLWQQLTEMLKREERFELVQAALSCLPAIVDLDLAGYTQVFEHG